MDNNNNPMNSTRKPIVLYSIESKLLHETKKNIVNKLPKLKF